MIYGEQMESRILRDKMNIDEKYDEHIYRFYGWKIIGPSNQELIKIPKDFKNLKKSIFFSPFGN